MMSTSPYSRASLILRQDCVMDSTIGEELRMFRRCHEVRRSC